MSKAKIDPKDVLSTKSDASKPLPKEGGDDDDIGWLDEGIITPEDAISPEDRENFPGKLNQIELDRILLHPDNANQMSEKEFDMLMRRMQEVGCTQPIQVAPVKDEEGKSGFYYMVDGEHRTKAARALGWTTIPALVFDGPEFETSDMRLFLGSQANMIRGKMSPDKFLPVYQRLVKQYDDKVLQDLMGFTDKAKWTMLTKGIADGLPDGAKEEFNKRAKNANPAELESILKEILSKYGNDLRFNFMILTLEGKEHTWIRMNDETFGCVKELAGLCRDNALDINIPLADGIETAIENFRKGKGDA